MAAIQVKGVDNVAQDVGNACKVCEEPITPTNLGFVGSYEGRPITVCVDCEQAVKEAGWL